MNPCISMDFVFNPLAFPILDRPALPAPARRPPPGSFYAARGPSEKSGRPARPAWRASPKWGKILTLNTRSIKINGFIYTTY